MELEEASEKLLKGCGQHFQAGVTRISKIGGIVPHGSTDAFKNRIKALLDGNTMI